MKKISDKNCSKNSHSKVIFDSENGKENTKNLSIYRFFVGQIRVIGLKEMDGWDQTSWDVE